jgi:hypothetical protein
MDRFRSVDRYALAHRGPIDDLARSGPCFLGDFEPVSEAQAAVIRRSLAQVRDSLRHAKSGERASP